jgi:hypothetical protein
MKRNFGTGSHAFLIYFCLLFAVYCLLFLSACGKKGDPTLKGYEKPEAPSGLRALHRESEIIISWDFPKTKEQGIRGFHLLKSTTGDFQKIAFVEKDIRSYRDTDVVPGQEYHYKVVSESLRGITFGSVVLSVKPLVPPQPPKHLSFQIDHDRLTLTWVRSDETSCYNIYRTIQKGQYGLTPLNSTPLKETSFTDAFDISRTVYYTVRSCVGGALRDEGAQSEELTVNPSELIPSSPQDLRAIPAIDAIFLLWKEPPETWVTGYRVYRKLDKQEGYVFIGLTHTPSFTDRDTATVKRNYRVSALGPSKESQPIEIRDVVYEPQR